MFKITEDEYLEMSDNHGGYCRACKEQAWGIEPDARKYRCDACGEHQVYGAEQLLIMGEIEFTEEEAVV